MNVQPRIDINVRRLAAGAVGAGLKPQHYAEILATRPEIGFFEFHAENYMSAGGPPHRWLAAIAEIYPLSAHGVGLSLGSAEKLDRERLARLARVVDLYRPALVSEHLAWSDFSGRAFPDLLPLPYDEANLRHIAEKIDATQTALGRAILIENPATYLRFSGDVFAETQFLDELASHAGCGLLLDVNNVHVSAVNHGFSARDYLDAFPLDCVEEIHLAGFAEARDARGIFLIDDHGGTVSDEVWALYAHVLRRAGRKPTLIEWDNKVPEWADLYAETRKVAGVQASAGSPSPLGPSPDGRSFERPMAGEFGATPDEGDSGRNPDSPSSGPSDHLLPQGEKERPIWLERQRQFAAALDNPALPPPSFFTDCDTSARFAVYRNNSAVAAIGALKEQFPTVTHLLGDEAFAELARIYAQKIPPYSPILGEYGGAFPDFTLSFLTHCSARAQTPYLPDIARLDWARLKALRAEEAPPRPRNTLSQLDPARLAGMKLKLHPSLSLVESHWPILAICNVDEAPVRDWRGETALVLRPGADLLCLACHPGAAAFLRACGEGETLGDAALAASETQDNFDFGRTLVELTEIGAIVDFEDS